MTDAAVPPTAPTADVDVAAGRPRVLVLAGRDRYSDPWHDTAATSYRVARALETDPAGAVGEVVVRSTFPDALDDLAGFDLLVVDTAGTPRGPGPRAERAGGADGSVVGSASGAVSGSAEDAAWAPLHEALRAYADAGRPVLGLHQSALSFADSPHWERILGGRWVEGRSMHPPIDDATFTLVAGDGHPLVAALAEGGVRQVEAFDERYALLDVADDVEVLAVHEHEGRAEPVVWVNRAGGLRVVYDALGHDVRSYDSASRTALLRAEVAWLLTDAHRPDVTPV